MQAKLQSDGKLLLLLDPEIDKDLHAQVIERYARKKWVEKDHPRAEKPPEHAGEFIEKEPNIKADPKEVEKHPYHNMESYPTFADTPEKRKILDSHPEVLKKWRELAMARVNMSTGERQKFNKILDPAFRALKEAYEQSAPKWNVVTKRKKQDTPEIEVSRVAKKKIAAVKVKIKEKKVSVAKVKEAVKAKKKKS
jgi:hypothetical protein